MDGPLKNAAAAADANQGSPALLSGLATSLSPDVASLLEARATHLTQHDVARRWRMSERTLEAWRWRKRGPAHLKIGGKIMYRLADVLAYEMANLQRGDR